jgi:hypothetical protein
LEMHFTCLARSLALASAGNKSDARMAMIAITTKSSISVKAYGQAVVVLMGDPVSN